MTWEALNTTPYQADYTFLCDHKAAEVWVVVVKGTSAIDEHGRPHCHKEQVPLDHAPRHRGDPAESSLLQDTYFAVAKSATYVLVEGHAHAPVGMAARRLNVGIAVGPIRKVVRVCGDRLWTWSM